MWTEKKKFPILLGFLQVLFIILFGVFGAYHEDTHSKHGIVGDAMDSLHPRYPMFLDIHIMVFVGFGFLMTYLKRYGLSALSYNMLLSSVAVQWVIIVQGLMRTGGAGFQLEVAGLVEGDFGAAAVLITFGALLGKTSPVQLLVVVMIEIVVYAINFHIGIELLGAVDAGGTMMIHTFGAYFGVAAAFILRYDWHKTHKENGSVYRSDMFAMIGTLFLWMCWPSFNGALLAVGNQQHRAIVNTYLSLAASCVTTFITSSLISKDSKFNMVHVQNATLAGGVAVGTCADMMVNPFGALLIGGLSGIISVLGYTYLTPFLETVGLHDTCGVHNLHGMPGIFGAIAGIVAAGIADPSLYGGGLSHVFPQRSAFVASNEHAHISHLNETVSMSEKVLATSGTDPGRTAGEQAGMQAAALVITLVLAIVGGLITGFIIRLSFWVPVIEEEGFQDDAWFDMPDQEDEPHTDVEMMPVQSADKKYAPVATQDPVQQIHITTHE